MKHGPGVLSQEVLIMTVEVCSGMGDVSGLVPNFMEIVLAYLE